MTDKETLCAYRMKQAGETLADARKMLQGDFSARSIINRAYYATFYAVLALLLNEEITLKTSKHAGVISLFDKEIVHRGKLDKPYSRILHKLFEARQEGDYRELVDFSREDSGKLVEMAEEFLKGIEKMMRG